MNGLPEDFDAFWAETVGAAMAAPLDYHRSNRVDRETSHHLVETFRFRGVGGETLHGWIAYAPDASREKAFLWIPPYGRESKLPDAYGTREGFVSLSFNFHGESAFHQEDYTPARGYFSHGAEDPETWIFRGMFQNSVLATRVLQAQVEADEHRIGAMGMSQGGGIAIWLGANLPLVRAVCADMPFLGNMMQSLEGNVYRYPTKELKDFMGQIPVGEARVENTVAYFDTVTQASRCEKPTQVSLGLRDPACRPDTVRAIYDAIPAAKRLVTYDWGHDWHPDMVEKNAEWLTENLR
ncbi:acetylxylan esterase [soil metagenome]